MQITLPPRPLVQAWAKTFLPPKKQKLSEWIEDTIRLASAVSALPGRVRLYPYQASIADAISDPKIERVTMVKAARVGFTTLLTGALGSYILNEPSPILVLLPTELDCRDYMVMDVEPIFEATPDLNGALLANNEVSKRNTLLAALPRRRAQDRRSESPAQPSPPYRPHPHGRRG